MHNKSFKKSSISTTPNMKTISEMFQSKSVPSQKMVKATSAFNTARQFKHIALEVFKVLSAEATQKKVDRQLVVSTCNVYSVKKIPAILTAIALELKEKSEKKVSVVPVQVVQEQSREMKSDLFQCEPVADSWEDLDVDEAEQEEEKVQVVPVVPVNPWKVIAKVHAVSIPNAKSKKSVKMGYMKGMKKVETVYCQSAKPVRQVEKTRLCRFRITGCTYKGCKFAHSLTELKPVQCRFGARCRHGTRCRYQHKGETVEQYAKRTNMV